MYSLTFRVRVTTPPQHGRNGMASLQITSRIARSRRVDFIAGACVRSACGMRWAWRITAGLCHACLVLPQQRIPYTDCKSAQ